MTTTLEAAARQHLVRPDVAAAVDIAVIVSYQLAVEKEIYQRSEVELLEVLEGVDLELACIRCGCTQFDACPGGCAWVSMEPPICSACA